jgi:manganese transport protein
MEGFLHLKMRPWAQRLMTRSIAIIPVVIVGSLYGDDGTARLLVLSQVILSMQLPFAVIPLVTFVSSKKTMGTFVISKKLAATAWGIAAIIVGLNAKLLFDTFVG